MTSISSVTTSQLSYASKLFSKMDTDGSGGISKDEFTSARPSDVSETQASSLYDSLDTSSTGALSLSDLEKMESGKNKQISGIGSNLDSGMMQTLLSNMEQSSETSTTTQSSGVDEMIAAMDTDSDGIVTKEEFVAARPDDVSEEMASNLWSSFDTESAGSLTTDSLQTAMASNGPHGPPPPPPSSSSSSEEAFDSLLEELTASLSSSEETGTTSSTETSQTTALQALLEAIKAYDSTAGYDSTQDVLSTLLAA